MFFAPHEWTRPVPLALSSHITRRSPLAPAGYRALYDRLSDPLQRPDEAACAEAAGLLQAQLDLATQSPCELPASAGELAGWMEDNGQRVSAAYALYLEGRKAGGPRRYFRNRAHALYVLRTIAPTKLVDGSWLYGLMTHWRNPRFADLVRTYLEELGDGLADKNHVVLYRKLLSATGIDPVDGLDDLAYLQGAVQLALGWNAQEFLPEVIGFNLGYEQLPLHLLITAYELNELGLDPYYFTLHVTVDNASTGHARRACQAVLDALPRIGDAEAFWQRVRRGSQLGDAGLGTNAVIDGFDIEREVLRILRQKSAAGQGAHSDYCRVAGRSINEWLADPDQMPAFLDALTAAGWIQRNQPVANSRFWGLLQGPRAEMFGVFSGYELQVIHDWIRGDASADGRAWDDGVPTQDRAAQRPSFRVQARLAAARGLATPAALAGDALLDPDLEALDDQLATRDAEAQMGLLVDAMAPAQHWTPAGLRATRLFRSRTGR